MKKTSTIAKHTWAFKPRFRSRAFGWRSQPAIQRIKEAVSEIKKVAKKDPVLAADGAVVFLKSVSSAIAQVDSSSGSMGSAVNRAIEQLVPIIAAAPADAQTRGEWLERLMAAIKADRIPYIELLGDFWGELCVTKEIASAQADALLDLTRLALSPNRRPGAFFYGTSACLSALLHAERYGEIVEILSEVTFWPYKQWAVKALVAQGTESRGAAGGGVLPGVRRPRDRSPLRRDPALLRDG